MVKKTIDGKEFDIGTISYGDFMDIQDKHTVTDINTGKDRLLNGKATRELCLAMVKDSEGKPVDIKNLEHCSFLQGALLDREIGKYFSTMNVKNLLEEQEAVSESLPTGKQ